MKLTKKEAQRIADNYNLGEVKTVKLMKEGVVNHNFVLKTVKGKFVIQVLYNYDKWKKERMDIEFKLLKYLKKKRFPYQIPFPIKNKKENYVSKTKNGYLWAYSFIEGDVIKNLNKTQFNEIAKAAAIFYKYTKDFKYKKKKDKYANDWIFKNYSKIKKIIPKNKIDKLVLDNIEFFENLLKRVEKFKIDDKITIAHKDFHQGNVIFNKNKLIGIIDFDDLGWHSRAKEVALAIVRTKYPKTGFNQKKKKIFLKEYEKYSKVSKKEKKLILPAVIEDYCTLILWFYSMMKKQKHKRYAWIKEVIRDAKRDAKLLI